MPEYLLAALAWLAGAAVLAGYAGVLRRRQAWLALGAFLVFTVVFDALLTGIPIVTYDAGHLSGILVGTTPIEDYLYGQALCLTAISVYELGRGRLARPPAGRTGAGR